MKKHRKSMRLLHQSLRPALVLALLLLTSNRGFAQRADIDMLGSAAGAPEGWTAKCDAFDGGLVSGVEELTRLEITNADGRAVASSEREGDGPIGVLVSAPFTIERPYLAFRIAGGDYEHSTCVNLLVNGKVVRSATGWRSDRLVPMSWDVEKFLGSEAKLQIVDAATGDWGHINLSRVVQTDSPERPPTPVEPLYHESLRPQVHFTARQWTMNRLNPGMREEGWINDLNGLIYYDGEYHLFAQRWAKCWLHAVSKDLVHWTELEPAFWEESLGSGVQSGTCVVDYENTSGLSPDDATPPLVAFWSRFDNRSQCLSYSLDHGRTWQAYDKNPFMEFPERDPKVFWYAPAKHWVMMMYGDGKYHIFTSPNLLDWEDTHHPIADSFECPDFFEMAVDGDSKNKKWVLIQGGGQYSIGDFDGERFTEETTERRPCDHGDFYATQSWHNTETGDGRRIQAAWMRGAQFPDMPFNQQITFPCELSLRTTDQGLRIFRRPIEELQSLHQSGDHWDHRVLRSGETLPLEPAGQLFHIRAKVSIPAGAELTFSIRGVPVRLTSDRVFSDRFDVKPLEEVHEVEFLIDVASIETFVNEGEVSATGSFCPSRTESKSKQKAAT
jgi:fructan beta-fructosidase